MATGTTTQTERLFVAAWPSDAALAVLDEMVRPEAVGVRWMPGENLHVTLLFLGRVHRDRAVDALSSARLTRCTAEIVADAEPLGRDSLVLPVRGVDALGVDVRAAVGHLVEHPDARPFRGHLTVARLRRGATPPPHVGIARPVAFAVDDVHLVASITGHQGATYSTVASFATAWAVPD
jgi:RNA 2',3'-cyclic 3'-phosphodiesterase